MDYRSLLYLRVWIFPSHLCGKATGSRLKLICAYAVRCLYVSHSTSACPQKPTYGLKGCVFFHSPKACLVDSVSSAGMGGGGLDEAQLLSDVNAAQTLCVCGHSPSDSSNQLMG